MSSDDMPDEQVIRVLAEYDEHDKTSARWKKYGEGHWHYDPDYLNDLNAMRRVEKKMMRTRDSCIWNKYVEQHYWDGSDDESTADWQWMSAGLSMPCHERACAAAQVLVDADTVKLEEEDA